MSDQNREYPEWLDRELFGHLNEDELFPASPADRPPETQESASERPAAKNAETSERPAPQKKKKSAKGEGRGDKAAKGEMRGEKSAAEKKPKAKKAAADTPAKEPAKKKKTKKTAAEEEDARLQELAAKKKSGNAMRGILITLIVIASLALVVCVGAMVCSDLISASDANLPNVYVDNVYVGGMTKEQTAQALRDAGWEKENGGTLQVKLPQDVSFELDYLKAGVTVPVEAIAEKAYAYGHSGDNISNLVTYVEDMLVAKDLGGYEVSLNEDYIAAAVNEAVDAFEKATEGEEYSVNEEASTLELVKGAGQVTLDRAAILARTREALLAREQEVEWTEVIGDPRMPDFSAIAATLAEEVHDAYYDPTTNEVVPETKGVEIDAAKAQQIWKEAGLLEKLSIPITIVEPEVKAEDLESALFRDQLGYCKTTLVGSTANRISNVSLACSRFDGMILMPGQRFSYNEIVGQRTEEAGFKIAGVYNGNKIEQDIGGGICQVSSTLYNAALLANLEINERSCHNLVVDYLPMGLDATVSWGGPEFVFTNNRDYPIKIKAGVQGRNLIIEIWGSNVDGSHVEMLNYVWPIYDEEWKTKYDIEVQIEWGARTVRRVYDADGNYQEFPEARSYYYLHEEEIRYPARPDAYEEDYEDEGTEVTADNVYEYVPE